MAFWQYNSETVSEKVIELRIDNETSKQLTTGQYAMDRVVGRSKNRKILQTLRKLNDYRNISTKIVVRGNGLFESDSHD